MFLNQVDNQIQSWHLLGLKLRTNGWDAYITFQKRTLAPSLLQVLFTSPCYRVILADIPASYPKLSSPWASLPSASLTPIWLCVLLDLLGPCLASCFLVLLASGLPGGLFVPSLFSSLPLSLPTPPYGPAQSRLFQITGCFLPHIYNKPSLQSVPRTIMAFIFSFNTFSVW